MSGTTKPTDSEVKSPTAESPTTAKPFSMDDDDVQESGVLSGDAPAATKHATVEDEPPAKPPRPLSHQQQAENTLKEAFPSIDAAVVKAVLMASGGRVEPAFNALLGMSDPDAVREPTPPPQPPRPQAQRVGSTPQSQLEADEQYARQLAEHYGGGWGSGGPRDTSRGAQPRRQQTGLRPNENYQENERSFIDDDLPVIRDNLKKGFLETQSKVNGWITNLKKRIDGEDVDEPQQGYTPGSSNQYRQRRSGDGRQSGDYGRYDADPEVLSDDFAGIQMNADGISFQGGPPEEIDIYRTSPKLGAKENAPPVGKQSKWQPLSTVDPSPIGEAENDPFSLGDSEDEKESKDRVGGKEIKMDDAERLKKAAAEAMADNIGDPARKPEPAETVGTKDKIADEKLTGKS
ncbi:related to CUE5 Protein containing a CUE domain that binds ubiquitin, which may facilitate intramolecular monoubiquitination [Phialocephala subalpina]|uniref:Related to CUE5 Protein containing a CUE domain that binds ubiquitin, which may facilitate intramolecular monoubiquitination n=1 Tax=Phialocephala subalpina TaxID=576137 RepID=A0A1L7WKI6_9HELO|nr:related to CUE5 Protein containing a CUE domain that binds ubiquitin, which may facilitate intramolecular monoubiquitination [Phialocephala subalpina]